MDLGWYARRLARMTPREIAGRVEDRVWHTALRAAGGRIRPGRVSVGAAPAGITIDPATSAALVEAAERILDGLWPVLGADRTDMMPVPDWFLDPTSGIAAPAAEYAFSIAHRDPGVVGDIKQVWEPSRHHHLTVLAAAYAATGHDRYARTVATHLADWWERNPFLIGVHWTSGIEVGIRLISWVWVRRLLAGWRGVEALFDENPAFHAQLFQHQYYLHRFPSRGSSANNHLVAEAAGALAAACAFPWFAESSHWEAEARRVLEAEVEIQTFPSGLNRELASEYHGLSLELFLLAAVEAGQAGRPLTTRYWEWMRRMFDALAAVVDVDLHPPRQGDSDDGTGLLVDHPDYHRWGSLIQTGADLFGAMPWWPKGVASVRSRVLTDLAHPPPLEASRPERRPDVFPEAGMAIMRSTTTAGHELWCRFDAGPHGFLSIAAHGHADALSVELRHHGVEVFADPGTYTYHSEPAWRSYFRSTRAHNTLELDGADQSVSAGPFMWSEQARSRLQAACGPDGVVECAGSHDGYRRLDPPVEHRRVVRRCPDGFEIEDVIHGGRSRPGRLSFHLGPDIDCALDAVTAGLSWEGGRAELSLPPELAWTAVRGETDPITGWYSPGFGRKVPAWTLIGTGMVSPESRLRTTVRFRSMRTTEG